MAASIYIYSDQHFDGVKALWQEVFPDDPPWNTAELSIPAKIAAQPELFLVAVEETKIVGSIMAGYDGHRGWLYAVAVHASHRNRGIGTALVHGAESRLEYLGCAKINLQIRSGNSSVVAFYRRLGYAEENRVSMGKHIRPSTGV